MAFTGNFMCTSFKAEILKAVHDFTLSSGSTFNVALYTNSASFTAATTAYTSANEITGTGYVAKGKALTNVTPTTGGTTGFTDFQDLTWSTASFTARGALLFNDTAASDPTCLVLDFGSDQTSTAGDFKIVFPTNDSTNAIIRIA
jgi:hypothetical protein|tara:strand:- start:36 stop:470 length:435 start_codon:yes stop_codon:yes gene_type:complete